MTDVPGYTEQSEVNTQLIGKTKEVEERLLRYVESIPRATQVDPRWLAIGITHFQQGFMAVVRAIAQPQRIPLPSDNQETQNVTDQVPEPTPEDDSGTVS